MRLIYLFIHRHTDYAYAELREFQPGTPSQVLAQSTLHYDPDEAWHDMGAYAAWRDLPVVRTSTIVHDRPFS